MPSITHKEKLESNWRIAIGRTLPDDPGFGRYGLVRPKVFRLGRRDQIPKS